MNQPQSETWHRRYTLPPRPDRVSAWLIGLGIVLMLVAAMGAAVAVALDAMQVPPQ